MWHKEIQKAKKMEKDATISKKEMVEISDEEIEKFAQNFYDKDGFTEWEVEAFKMGMKQYREQLKQKQ